MARQPLPYNNKGGGHHMVAFFNGKHAGIVTAILIGQVRKTAQDVAIFRLAQLQPAADALHISANIWIFHQTYGRKLNRSHAITTQYHEAQLRRPSY